MSTRSGLSRALLDTSVLILSNGDAVELPETAAISVVTLGELHAGVRLARDGAVGARRRRRLEAVLQAFAALDVDGAVAERYGEVLAVARDARRAAKATDLLIIATALAHGRTLYTRDTRQAEIAEMAGVDVRSV